VLPGTRSAIAGGTTTLIAFAPQKKSEPSLLACLEATHARARDNCYSDYSFHLICSNAGLTAISEFEALRKAGISSLKIYMTYEALQLKDSEILDVLFEARKQKIVTMIHAENGAIIDWTIKKLEEKKLFDPKFHVTSHPPVAEIEATYRAISLSGFIDVPILIVVRLISKLVSTFCIRALEPRRWPINKGRTTGIRLLKQLPSFRVPLYIY
jgi:dihydropyrimidinase